MRNDLRARRLSAAFSHELGFQEPRPPLLGGHLGLEHEYIVRNQGVPVPFTALVAGLGLGRRNLDPGDPQAYRRPSGAAVTCDGDEAEIALSPIAFSPGAAAEMAASAGWEEASLLARLPAGHTLDGCSTHISVSVPTSQAGVLARRYALSYASAMMLLLDDAASPGLLVRPRPGRVEICGEFGRGDRLTAAIAFAAASVVSCGRNQSFPWPWRRGPRRLAIEPEPARARRGWYIDRRAFGVDLYSLGRQALMPLRGGGTVTAQEYLLECWHSMQPVVGDRASAAEAALVDGMIDGSIPLPVECRSGGFAGDAHRGIPSRPAPGLLQPLTRPGFAMAPVMVTWDATVLLLSSARGVRTAYASVPRPAAPAFIDRLHAGKLDDVLGRYLAMPAGSRVLANHAELARPGLHDTLGSRRELLAPDGPQRGRA